MKEGISIRKILNELLQEITYGTAEISLVQGEYRVRTSKYTAWFNDSYVDITVNDQNNYSHYFTLTFCHVVEDINPASSIKYALNII